MPRDPDPLTLAEAARRACDLVDPDDDDAAIGDFEQAFEDADEPIRALDDVEERVGTVLSELAMAGAVTVYLRFRPGEYGAEPAKLLRLAAEAEWEGDPPDVVVDWLAGRDIRL
jgi:hypothetical protein